VISETLMNIDPEDDIHEWAYEAANRYCESQISLLDVINEAHPGKITQDLVQARALYLALFNAFVVGAVFAKQEKD